MYAHASFVCPTVKQLDHITMYAHASFVCPTVKQLGPYNYVEHTLFCSWALCRIFVKFVIYRLLYLYPLLIQLEGLGILESSGDLSAGESMCLKPHLHFSSYLNEKNYTWSL